MEPREVAERYYNAIDTTDASQIGAVLTEDCKVEAPGVTLQGPEQVVGWMQVFFTAFPDIHHEHGEVVVDGNSVSTTLHIVGTHTGPLLSPEGEIPPTGRRVAFDATNEMTVRGDLVESLKTDFDQIDFMSQLGLS